MSLATLQYTFAEVFPEYYALWRGRVTNLPEFGHREYDLAIQYGNEALKKWGRGAEGTLWRELIDLASRQNTTVWPTLQRTIATATLTYAMPTNMRKTPNFIRVGTGTHDILVIKPEKALDMASNSTYAYFIGGANQGFTLVLPSAVASQYNGQTMDFVYDKKPVLLRTDVDPAATVIEMSDPAFMIHRMVQLRATKQRTGFVYNTSKVEATEALQAMKLENTINHYNQAYNAMAEQLPGGWGRSSAGESFFGVR